MAWLLRLLDRSCEPCQGNRKPTLASVEIKKFSKFLSDPRLRLHLLDFRDCGGLVTVGNSSAPIIFAIGFACLPQTTANRTEA